MQGVRDVGDLGTGARENQRLLVGLHQEQVDQCVEALPRRDEVNDVVDIVVGGAERGALNGRGVLLHTVREGSHLSIESG